MILIILGILILIGWISVVINLVVNDHDILAIGGTIAIAFLIMFMFGLGCGHIRDSINLEERIFSVTQERTAYVQLLEKNQNNFLSNASAENVYLYEQIIDFNLQVNKANNENVIYRGILYDSAYKGLELIPLD